MKSNTILAELSALVLSVPAPASAATVMKTFNGVLLPGIDTLRVLGTPGAGVGGLPFSYSVLWHTEAAIYRTGPDFTAPIYRVSGQVGDAKIRFQAATGSVDRLETPEGPYEVSATPMDGIGFVGRAYDAYGSHPEEEFDPYEIAWFYAPVSIGGQRFAMGDITSHPEVVLTGSLPEPSTWLMLLAGFGAIGALTRRSGVRRAALAAA